MKPTKKQPNIFPLRFGSKAQREIVRKAAKLERRSMNNYILGHILGIAGTRVMEAANAAMEQVEA